jgi:hypothetical protein
MFTCTNRPANFVGQHRGPCNLIGSARCVWEDLRDSPYKEAPSVGCNDAGVYAPRMLHWVSMHKEFFEPAVALRRYHYPDEPFITHAWKKNARAVDYVWFSDIVPDTSGCFGVMMALMFGFSPVIMCGIPLDDSGRFHAPHTESRVGAYVTTNDTWAWLKREHGRKIRSMSGRSRELFGAP